MPYRVPPPVVVDVPGQGLMVFMPLGPRQGHEPTHYIRVDACVILVECPDCAAAINKCCVFNDKERNGTHWTRRRAAKHLTKQLRASVLRFGKIIPDDVLIQAKSTDA